MAKATKEYGYSQKDPYPGDSFSLETSTGPKVKAMGQTHIINKKNSPERPAKKAKKASY